MPQPYPLTPVVSSVVVASPALAAETIIAQVTLGSVADPTSSVILNGWAAYTVGTSGTAVRFRIRRGGLTGTLVVDTGALTQTRTAGNLCADDVNGSDTPGEQASLVYALTMQVTAGAAQSTVSAVYLSAQPSG